MPLLFAVTLFFSASLLFMVQPMVARMVLPLLGGSPAVWNACMVFFQALLLIGYLYADRVTTRLPPRRQWLVHMAVMGVPLLFMGAAVVLGPTHAPIAVAEALAPLGETYPVLGVLALLTVAIGVPFFVASTSAPLLQKWFAFTGHPSARDPYFLYAASNLGSLISLLGYPVLIEPNLGLTQQAWLWGTGFAGLIGLIFVCGRAAANPLGVPPQLAGVRKPAAAAPGWGDAPAPTLRRKLKWLALAFVPSSLLLGVTFHMTTDIASIPLLWVIPLALYLVTFIIAFMRLPDWFRLVVGNFGPVMILLLVFLMLSDVTADKPGLTLLIHLATFFVAALMCHYELARDRPTPQFLTNYYLWISLGGVLGGVFNALVAPLVFPVAFEYPLTLVVACLLVPKFEVAAAPGPKGVWADPVGAGLRRVFPGGYSERRVGWALDLAFPVLLGLFFWWIQSLGGKRWFVDLIGEASNAQSLIGFFAIRNIVVFAVPVMLCFFFVERPTRFALCVAALLGVGLFRDERRTGVVHVERSFFGILRVKEKYGQRDLVHGTTLHGTQFFDRDLMAQWDNEIGRNNEVVRNSNWLYGLHPLASFGPADVAFVGGALAAYDPRQEPLTYYHRTGPVGAFFHELTTRKGGADATADVAMVGLGTGSVSCYARPGQRLTFFEIDPAVRRLVEPPDYFTYISDARARGATIDFEMGDARLRLNALKDRKYALLLVDAFSSDSIPIHLLTTEAVRLYLDRLTPDGLLALHVSNKYVHLEPVVARIAADLGVQARVWNDQWARRDGDADYNREEDPPSGKSASSWVILTRDEATLGKLAGPLAAQAAAFGLRNPPLSRFFRQYGPDADAREVLKKEFAIDALSPPEVEAKYGRAAGLLARRMGSPDVVKGLRLKDLALIVYGDLFHPLDVIDGMPAWTDDYADVLRVMMIPEVQWARRQFGAAGSKAESP